MLKLTEWLAERGPRIAEALELQREQLCETVSQKLAANFPTLCYDPGRYDAISFQQLTFRETPHRFHRLMQVLLCFQTFQVIEREYRWGWPIMRCYGVEPYHLYAQVRWYFDAIRLHVALSSEDGVQMNSLAAAILHIVEDVTNDTLPIPAHDPFRKNGFYP